MMRQSAAFLLALLLSGCVITTASPGAHVFSPKELNTDPEKHDGQEVVVRGFVILGTNGRSLYQSKEKFEEAERAFNAQEPGFNVADYGGDCLTMLNAHVLQDNMSLFNGQTITVRGRFMSNYLTGDVLDLQACSERTALVLDERDTQRLLRELQHAH